MSTKNFSTSFRIEESLIRKVEKLAEKWERPKSYIIKKTLEEYLSKYADGQAENR